MSLLDDPLCAKVARLVGIGNQEEGSHGLHARRDLLSLSGSALAGTVLAPSALRAQTPKRGGA